MEEHYFWKENATKDRKTYILIGLFSYLGQLFITYTYKSGCDMIDIMDIRSKLIKRSYSKPRISKRLKIISRFQASYWRELGTITYQLFKVRAKATVEYNQTIFFKAR